MSLSGSLRLPGGPLEMAGNRRPRGMVAASPQGEETKPGLKVLSGDFQSGKWEGGSRKG